MQYADQITTFKLGKPVLPGITSLPATWHTPGHAIFVFDAPADGGAAGPFAVCMDAANHIVLSIENPAIQHVFDIAPKRGVRGRIRLLRKFAKLKARTLFSHAAFPGIGGVSVQSKAEKTFRWWPVYWQN